MIQVSSEGVGGEALILCPPASIQNLSWPSTRMTSWAKFSLNTKIGFFGKQQLKHIIRAVKFTYRFLSFCGGSNRIQVSLSRLK